MSRLPLFETRVGRRLLLLFLLAAGMPITVLAIVSYRHVVGQLEAQGLARLDGLAKSTGMTIGARLMALKSELQDMADAMAALPPGSDLRQAVMAPPSGFTEVTLGAPSRVDGAPTAATMARLAKGGAVLQPVRTGQFMIGVPVPRSADVLWGIIDPTPLWALQGERGTVAVGQDFCVFEHTTTVLACSLSAPAELIAALPGPDSHERRLQWTSQRQVLQGSTWELFLGYEFGIPAWRVVVAEPRADILAPIAGFTRTFVAVLALTGFFVMGLVAYLLRHSLVPLRQLMEATTRLAARELGTRVATRVGARDEFDDVADSFNRMAGELEQHIGGLQAINAIDRAILSTLDRADVTRTVLTHAMEHAQADVVAFGLAPSQDSGAPWQVTMQRRGTVDLEPHRVVIGDRGLAPLDPADAASPLEGELLGQLGWHDIRSGWLIPVQERGQSVGALVVGYCTDRGLDDTMRLRLRHLLDQAAVAVKNVRLVEELGDLQRGALHALAGTIDAKSSWTAGHSERVTITAVALGRWLKLPESDLERLYRGGLLHDIGKIAIPSDVLDKAGRLTAAERSLIETHPGVGARILEPVKPFADVLCLVRNHHERWDGLGYPDRLAGDKIPFLARVLAVADVFDAVSSARPYRAATPRPEALEMIESGIGSMFDPEIANAFLSMMAGTETTTVTAAAEDQPEASGSDTRSLVSVLNGLAV